MEKMDANTELFNYILQNAQMGKDTLKELVVIVENKRFRHQIQKMRDQYNLIFDKANTALEFLNEEKKEINPLLKASSYWMIKMKTLTNKSPSHIAKMMIQGSTMGITQITQKLNSYHRVDRRIRKLARILLKIEENNVQKLKKWL